MAGGSGQRGYVCGDAITFLSRELLMLVAGRGRRAALQRAYVPRWCEPRAHRCAVGPTSRPGPHEGAPSDRSCRWLMGRG